MARHASELPQGDKFFKSEARMMKSEGQGGAPVVMVRNNLEAIPEFALPTGFSLRWYQPGDEENWFRIQAAADQFNEITPELFQRQFGTDQGMLAQRQCYLLDATGKAVGTGTAWFNDNFQGEKFGRVHWIAVLTPV